MASKEEILKEIDFLSDRLSTQVRTVAISVIAVAWLFLIGGKDAPILPVPPSRTLILLAGGFALAALLIDYFQYLMDVFYLLNLVEMLNSLNFQFYNQYPGYNISYNIILYICYMASYK